MEFCWAALFSVNTERKISVLHGRPTASRSLLVQRQINGKAAPLLRLAIHLNASFRQFYPDILIMTQSGKLICAETKGEHLKNDDSREKIALGQAWRTAAGKDFRYYMVFENEENLLPGAMSMSQFIDTVKAL